MDDTTSRDPVSIDVCLCVCVTVSWTGKVPLCRNGSRSTALVQEKDRAMARPRQRGRNFLSGARDRRSNPIAHLGSQVALGAQAA